MSTRPEVNLRVNFKVNGRVVHADVEPRWMLADFLREQLDLTGTHLGCEHGVCGACTVLMNGEPVRACLLFAVQAEGTEITTVEGLSGAGALSPLQQAFSDCHALQCGFCTPGMITTVHAFLAENPAPSAAEVRAAISGNLCRCTGYLPIVEAVLQAAAAARERARGG
jgi:carbon-monoxide dehydrogenase small subunit